MKNGLYYTGDLGKMDKDGFLYVVGRIKDMIKIGGERVSAKEIEEAIVEMDEVHEVAVIAVDDRILGEAIKAIIVPQNGVVKQDYIHKFLEKKLPHYKIPKCFEFRKSLPKNESGKVMKEILRPEYCLICRFAVVDYRISPDRIRKAKAQLLCRDLPESVALL